MKLTTDIVIADFEDSFTMNIAHTIWSIAPELSIDVIDHTALPDVQLQSEQLIILGPGPHAPKHLPHAVQWLKDHSSKHDVFGLCLGMQLMCAADTSLAAAKTPIARMHTPRHGQSLELLVREHEIFSDMTRPIHMIGYNSLATTSWSDDWDIIAEDMEGHIMAVAHRNRRHIGTQFHPESAGSLERLVFFKNLLSFYGIPLTSSTEIL